MSETQQSVEGKLNKIILLGVVLILVLQIGLLITFGDRSDLIERRIALNLEPRVELMSDQLNKIYVSWEASQLSSIPWQETESAGCSSFERDVGIDENTVIQFTIPRCGSCIEQERTLRDLQRNWNLKYVKVCVGEIASDWDECEKMGYILNNSVSMAEKYELTQLPTLVAGCKTKRTGTLAPYSQDLEYNDLKALLTNMSIINATNTN